MRGTTVRDEPPRRRTPNRGQKPDGKNNDGTHEVPPVLLTGQNLTQTELVQVARARRPLVLTEDALRRLEASHEVVRRKMQEGRPVYGITTGFGKLANISIDRAQSRELQKNLIMSHACGVGKPFATEIVRAIMLLRANALAAGYSGVNPRIVETLVAMLNRGVHPVVPEKGSLGASGDLANLAHVALVLIGLGEAEFRGATMSGAAAMEAAGIAPVALEGKDGLGLINGTQIMAALGSLHVADAELLCRTANIAGALTLEAMRGLTAAFDPRIHALRPHPGQIACARDILELIEGSTYVNGCDRVQDAYTLRCIPQVHGASLDAVAYAAHVLDIERNAVTDNPLVFPDGEEVLSGGNFHGQPLAFALDFLGIAVSELADISERRIERLVNPQLSGLPAFLARNSGVHSGYMIAQYTAASLVSENKILASPASVDSIPSSANQEDHVSMGAISARKAGQILENAQTVLAIELMCAAQAIDLQGDARLGRGTGAAWREIRRVVPALDGDRVLAPDIKAMTELVAGGGLVEAVRRALGRAA